VSVRAYHQPRPGGEVIEESRRSHIAEQQVGVVDECCNDVGQPFLVAVSKIHAPFPRWAAAFTERHPPQQPHFFGRPVSLVLKRKFRTCRWRRTPSRLKSPNATPMPLPALFEKPNATATSVNVPLRLLWNNWFGRPHTDRDRNRCADSPGRKTAPSWHPRPPSSNKSSQPSLSKSNRPADMPHILPYWASMPMTPALAVTSPKVPSPRL